MPVLVCLTFGDKLYAEHMYMTPQQEHPPKELMERVLKEQLAVSAWLQKET